MVQSGCRRHQEVSTIKRHCFRGAALAFVILCALAPGKAFCAGDPWYRDVSGHWAYSYIRILWEESVTDGYIPSENENTAYYMPDSEATRAQLATLLCKVFALPPCYPESPSYPDVPKSYQLFWNKPGWPWIEGALQGGITFVPGGQRFYPSSYITREDAVELLIRSLDLADYALSLAESEVSEILARFYDRGSISQARRNSMACAVRLGIIQGYEDGSVRPRACMSRAEAATVVARSCLIRMSADRPCFSPDGDGIDESVTFALTYLRNRGISVWQAAVQDSAGRPLYVFNPGEQPGVPPPALSWGGADSSGRLMPSGQYYYQAWVKDRANRQFFSVRRPLVLERHILDAWLSPCICRDGDVFTFGARTQHGALSVTAFFPDRPRSFIPVTPYTEWTLSLTMGPFLSMGTHNIVLKATFADARREVSLPLTRVEDIWLSPSVVPNPATWGQQLALRCDAAAAVTSAEATIFGSTAVLSRTGGSRWQGSATVPWGLAPGYYPVAFTVRTAASAAQQTVSLQVKGPDVGSLTYFLSK
jgi:hypothetical protein